MKIPLGFVAGMVLGNALLATLPESGVQSASSLEMVNEFALGGIGVAWNPRAKERFATFFRVPTLLLDLKKF
jgi:hypothetical protein